MYQGFVEYTFEICLFPECKYDKGEWSPCDETSQTVSRLLIFREGDAGCEVTLNFTISCARYQRIQEWKARKLEMKNTKKAQKQQRKEEISQLRESWLLVRAQKKRKFVLK